MANLWKPQKNGNYPSRCIFLCASSMALGIAILICQIVPSSDPLAFYLM